ncbi:hypothetical protein G3580_14725 [Nitrogeniibacter mangrovi]|uniref:Uncharacterized protein n=1 Tax=Nitrogeniibacter mangrovi TaxID=2016596 RepID=A0A6C1B7H3_9RHOO|nr:hypothetical protein [Nitrogeniibacter mangrovi]QID18765.1 hypothetical protein G3580_14725 [Nitrogeniibacter mangrovi]
MAEEHESAVELADIMMSFGRVQGAAETLAEFIRGNPKKAVQPWIKLLEVYKAANMRGEFDALTDKLNKTFNVKTVSWDDFDEVKLAPDSVEQMPHIISLLQKEWMTRECQIYLQKLLRDNRGGTRQGFPLGVVDDLLMLQAVLEDQLGPYRMTDEELAAALAGTGEGGPQTRSEDAPGESDAGFVAPPQELAPDLDFEAPDPSSGEPSGLEETELFDLDHTPERTELPALDFQLDSGDLDNREDASSEERTEETPDDESDDSDAPPDQTWLIPPPGKPD